MKYIHLTIVEREKIQKLLWQKKSLRYIAQKIGRSVSSISREMERNCPSKRKYTPRKAHERALVKRTKRDIKECISHEAIYQYIYSEIHRNGYGSVRKQAEDLRIYLKRRHKRRVKKGMRKCQRIYNTQGISIDCRPKSVETRKQIGHWEGDSIVSKKSKVILNTLVERKTGYVFITKAKSGTAKETCTAVVSRLSVLPPQLRRTLTLDNGSENTCHEELTHLLGIRCFKCHPYHSWERGTNENTNGLVRWYLPKGTDFDAISDEQISAIEFALNTRPRKRLGWKTPLQMMRVALKG